MSGGSTYKFIFLYLTVDMQHKKHKTETNVTNYFRVIWGGGKVIFLEKTFIMFSLFINALLYRSEKKNAN